jgi:N-acyl amino acid synthase of PEP-CTERM/exosortase system
MSDLIRAFNGNFEKVVANTLDLKAEVFRLRYQVYCLETGFEKTENCPDGLEIDAYDQQSVHYLIKHRKTGLYVATTRLILPDVKNPDVKFPIEVHCVIDDFKVIEHLPRNELAEVSRFCVSKECKKRGKEYGTLTGVSDGSDVVFSEDERRTFPHISLALIACLVEISSGLGINYWYAVMEPALLRFLSALGIYFTPIGPLTDYHGKRQPCVIKVSDLLISVAEKNPALWEMLTNKGQYL